MCSKSRIPRVYLGAVAGLVCGVAGRASADCVSSPNAPDCYHLKGSDTLFDIITAGINAARAGGVPGANNLFYDGTGSGNAESQMRFAGGTSAPNGQHDLGVQSIGPMSRNFRPNEIDSLAVGYVQRDATHLGAPAVGHAAWAPTCTNVLGLDAAVLVSRLTGAGSSCKNLDFPTFVDNSIPASAVARANTNNTALASAFGDGSAFNNKSATNNYSNLLMVILSGVDGSGSLAACSDPRRIQALQDLANCMGVDHIEHLYRRDDNSGTTDTWKDRVMITGSTADPRYPWVGGRFCNNQSIGGINGATTQTGICSVTRSINTCKVDTDCPTAEVCQFNLNNQDFDPIRRSCVGPDATHAPTTCTDMTTGLACRASDNNPNCTEGLIVALSDTDPGSTDITTSIAARVKNDVNGLTIGYAGREAANSARGTKAFTMNTIGPTDSNVRKETYLLSRRLFLQNGGLSGTTDDDLIDDLAGPNISITGGGAAQFSAEQNFFNWATNHANIDQIVKDKGFITCAPNIGDDPCALSNNLCAKVPAAAVAAALGAMRPNGSVGASGSGGSFYIRHDGLSSTGAQFACSAGDVCIGGASCTGGLCPALTPRPVNSACTVDSDCQAGLHCVDGLAIGIPGSPISLICQ
ncbi:MAG TPA: hypothetical protein VLW85_13365 [Myxococcales bacterium]|nr:hypothetical protein [Myxococcales bacterium]